MLRPAAVLLAVVVLLTGCVPAFTIPPMSTDSPAQAVWSVLGAPSPAGAELAAAEEAGAEASVDLIAGADEELLSLLGHPEYVPAGGGLGVAPLRALVPGLDQPIEVSRGDDTRTRETPVGTLTETGRLEHTVSDQRASFLMDTTTTITQDGEIVARDARQSTVEADVCALDDDGTVSADWTLERRIEDTKDDGTRVRLELSANATVTSGSTPSASARIDDFELRVTRTTTATDGSRTTDRGTVGGRFETWGSDVLPTDAEWGSMRDPRGEGGEWFADEVGKLMLGTLGASTHEFIAVLRTALEARQESGLCVSLEVDAGGVTTLANGDSVSIVARVVDTRTGEPVDAAITAETSDGTVAPGAGPSPLTVTFTAGSDYPAKTVRFETSGPRGGDRATVTFTTGWSFDGVELSVSVDDYTGYQQWSGYVCGDPFTEPWHFTQVVDGFVVEYDLVVPPVGTRINSEYGQQPMIERVANPAEGDPPFILYIDDIEPPEVTPQAQRIEVDVREGAAACEG